jgi:hypothetical protein
MIQMLFCHVLRPAFVKALDSCVYVLSPAKLFVTLIADVGNMHMVEGMCNINVLHVDCHDVVTPLTWVMADSLVHVVLCNSHAHKCKSHALEKCFRGSIADCHHREAC